MIRVSALALSALLAYPPSSTTSAAAPRHPRGPLPDPTCTPGAIDVTDLAVICAHSTRDRRHVTEATRRAVLEQYGWPTGDYELDHLVPLELGGSNDVTNLWPEAGPGWREKDRVEDALHARVCAERMTLAEAQRVMERDWTQMKGD